MPLRLMSRFIAERFAMACFRYAWKPSPSVAPSIRANISAASSVTPLNISFAYCEATPRETV